MIIDAHLDIAYNASHGRAVLGPAKDQTPDREGIPTVGLPDLHTGGVSMVCATIFAEPASPQYTGYTTAEEAHAAGMWQMQWYLDREKEGHFRIVRSGEDVENLAPSRALPAIILLEGADPIRTPDEVPLWKDQGVRIVGLAWRQTRYAG